MNENHLTVVKENEFGKPLFHKIDFIIASCIGDCIIRYFYTFDHISVYDIKLTNITNIEILNLTFSDKSMILYELKKLKVARQNGFVFIQMKKLTKKILLIYLK